MRLNLFKKGRNSPPLPAKMMNSECITGNNPQRHSAEQTKRLTRSLSEIQTDLISFYIDQIKSAETKAEAATGWNNLGRLYQKRSKNTFENDENNALALKAYKMSLLLRIQDKGKKDISVATALNNLSSVYFASGDFERSIKYYNSSLEIMISKDGKYSLNVATIYNNIGDAHHGQGMDDAALEAYENAYKIRSKHFDENDERIARLQGKINLIKWKLNALHGSVASISSEDFVSTSNFVTHELSQDMAKLTSLYRNLTNEVEDICLGSDEDEEDSGKRARDEDLNISKLSINNKPSSEKRIKQCRLT